MPTNFYDFSLVIINDLSRLLIVLGLTLFIISFIRIKGIIEINNAKEAWITRFIGFFILILGLILAIPHCPVDIHGTVTYLDGSPVQGAKIKACNVSDTTNHEGVFTLPSVPRWSRKIEITLPKLVYSEIIDMPIFAQTAEPKIIIDGLKLKCRISGKVEDEYQDPIYPAVVQVAADTVATTDLNGQYTLIDVAYDPMNTTYLSVYLPNYRYPIYKEVLLLSPEEWIEKEKTLNITIHSAETIDVCGIIKQYCGHENEKPLPLIDAKIEIGGRFNISDDEGKFYVSKVPRKAVLFNITDASGDDNVTQFIIPPLNYESRYEKVAKRRFIIC
jgi:hypothetical protein